MSKEITTRSSVIEKKQSLWEAEQKARFVQLATDPNAKYSDVIEYALNEDKQNHKIARVNYRLKCFRDDGVYQLYKAIQKVFGTVVAQEEKSPSNGNGDIQTIDITLANGQRLKCPFGDIALPGLGDDAQVSISYNEDKHDLVITGKCQLRFQSLLDDIIEEAKIGLATNSIYKGQAIEISDINQPKILDLSSIDNQLMVLSKKTQYDLRPIYARLNNPQLCIDKGIPLKFGALLEGSYGTGKTLLAFKLARHAIQNGWMFIYLKDPTLLAEILKMSKVIDHSGWGVVIFCEDVDQVVRGNRDEAMQDILNTLDGGDTKDMNVISLFTTNHIELIEPTFLRGKRIGTIVSMGSLDADAAIDFIKASFAIGEYTLKDDLKEVGDMIAQYQIVPAFMAEIIEKVKANMILANQTEVKAEDIKFSIESYIHQMELSRTKNLSKSPAEELVEAISKCFGTESAKGKALLEKLDTIYEYCNG